MNNTSYVCIPADKLVELIKRLCPPGMSPANNNICLDDIIHSDMGVPAKNCVKCWHKWFKDGE